MFAYFWIKRLLIMIVTVREFYDMRVWKKIFRSHFANGKHIKIYFTAGYRNKLWPFILAEKFHITEIKEENIFVCL